jgi:hypothetical protein
MPTLHQYDYLFAFGVIFCTLDAFMIGESWLRILATSCKKRKMLTTLCSSRLARFRCQRCRQRVRDRRSLEIVDDATSHGSRRHL